MCTTVILRHDCPDGSHHFDWMIDAGEGLTTFRVRERIDGPGLDVFEAERLADHRRAYLDYEGEISGGRGFVTRVARGWCRVGLLSDREADLRLRFGRDEARWRGESADGRAWRFSRIPA